MPIKQVANPPQEPVIDPIDAKKAEDEAKKSKGKVRIIKTSLCIAGFIFFL